MAAVASIAWLQVVITECVKQFVNMPSFYCSICEYKTRFLNFLLRHYDEHCHLPDFIVKCIVPNCGRTYKTVGSLRNHLSFKHNTFLKKKPDQGLPNTNDGEMDCETSDYEIDCDKIEPNSGLNDESSQIVSSQFDCDRHIKLFLMNLRVKKYVSESCTELIIQQYQSILNNCNSEISNNINQFCDILSEEQKALITQPLNTMLSKLNSYNTVHKQNAKFKEEHFVDPVEITLEGNKKTVYVPILETLKLLLGHEDILACVSQSKNVSDSDSTVVSDFASSKKGREFMSNTDLQIQLYFDDYTLTNPLAASSRKHKICAVYFQLGNIPHQYRSKLSTIQLVSLTKSTVIKEFGMNVVFSQLLQDLKVLETDGISIVFDSNVFHYKGSVTTLIADNLAAHEVGGYIACFSGFRMCRFCNASKNSSKNNFLECKFTLRTVESYTAQLDLVQQNSNLSSVYGLKYNCFLNELRLFHICWGSPSDIAHDLFEGVCLDLLSVVLEYSISNKYFDLAYLNMRIKSFPYFGKDIRNKPEQLLAKGSKINIKLTASQCQCLVKLLPLLIGHKVPTDCQYWQCYLLFLDCLDFILAPSLTIGQIQHMSDLILTFLENYSSLNDSINIKPKAHYMVHYATQYKYFGPMINHSTLRYEGKHSNLKSLFGSCRNYRNPCLTIARRHQNLQALHHHNRNFLEDDEILTKKSSEDVPIHLIPCPIRTILQDVNVGESVNLLKKIKYHGITYEENCIVVCGYKYTESYQFGQLHRALFIRGSLHLIIEILNIDEFSTHLHCFVLKGGNSKRYKIININSLLSPHIVSPYVSQHGILAILPHFIRFQ